MSQPSLFWKFPILFLKQSFSWVTLANDCGVAVGGPSICYPELERPSHAPQYVPPLPGPQASCQLPSWGIYTYGPLYLECSFNKIFCTAYHSSLCSNITPLPADTGSKGPLLPLSSSLPYVIFIRALSIRCSMIRLLVSSTEQQTCLSFSLSWNDLNWENNPFLNFHLNHSNLFQRSFLPSPTADHPPHIYL